MMMRSLLAVSTVVLTTAFAFSAYAQAPESTPSQVIQPAGSEHSQPTTTLTEPATAPTEAAAAAHEGQVQAADAHGEIGAASTTEAHGHGGGGVPIVVLYQTINFLLFVGLLVFFLRKPVREYFSGREAAFKAALVKAQAAKAEAEAQKRDIQERLNKLQSESDKAVAAAKAEAEQLKARIVKEAQDLAANLRQEAQRAASFEIQRAKNELREDLLNQSVALSAKILQEKVGEADQKRLQTEFVDKIEVR